jgi:integrase
MKRKICPKCGVRKYKYYLVTTVDRKLIFKYAGETLREAKLFEAKFMLNKTRLICSKIYFYDFIEQIFLPYYVNKNFSRQSCKNRKLTWFICSKLPNKPLDKITVLDVENFFTDLMVRGLKVSTRNRYLAFLKGLFNYALRLGYIESSPVRTNAIKGDNVRNRWLKPAEKEKLLHVCERHGYNRLYNMIVIALDTGMRLGEIRALQKTDVRDGMLYIRAETTKTGSARVIPLTKRLSALFVRLSDDEWNFNHSIQYPFTKVLKIAGIENFCFHDLRHTFASELVQKGVSDYIVAELLGHTSTKMTKRYSHLSAESLAKAVKLIN